MKILETYSLLLKGTFSNSFLNSRFKHRFFLNTFRKSKEFSTKLYILILAASILISCENTVENKLLNSKADAGDDQESFVGSYVSLIQKKVYSLMEM